MVHAKHLYHKTGRLRVSCPKFHPPLSPLPPVMLRGCRTMWNDAQACSGNETSWWPAREMLCISRKMIYIDVSIYVMVLNYGRGRIRETGSPGRKIIRVGPLDRGDKNASSWWVHAGSGVGFSEAKRGCDFAFGPVGVLAPPGRKDGRERGKAEATASSPSPGATAPATCGPGTSRRSGAGSHPGRVTQPGRLEQDHQ